MNKSQILQRYIDLYNNKLKGNKKILNLLKDQGISEGFIIENFNLGFPDGSLLDSIGNNKELLEKFTELGIIKNNKEVYLNHLIIPIYEDKGIENIIFYNLASNSANNVSYLFDKGIFNNAFLRNTKEIVLTESPIDTLILLQNNFPNTTFLYGDNSKFIRFAEEFKIKKSFFTMDGHARLFFSFSSNGISSKRIITDFKHFNSNFFRENLSGNTIENQDNSSDVIREIENGFLFTFPHLSYRVIGNFADYTMVMKANIKVFKENEVFVNSIDLYKHKDRQGFIFDVMDKFNYRDQVQLENDLTLIIDVIEKHKEKKENEKKKVKPELSEHQKEIGMKFLKNPDLIKEIAKDINDLGYVREDKNKILMYLIMTSRLLPDPLSAMVISRSSAGKSRLVEIIEKCCPEEELESVSDLSQQAMYYYEQDQLKHKFIVIGEKEGSKGSDYPLRELISKKSIKKAVPVKDGLTGQIKTVNIQVNGPVSLVITTTDSNVNPENLNRCFVISIDETTEQTRLIHDNQRESFTVEGHMKRKEKEKIIEKHNYAQRLLKKVHTFNPYATLLSFPASRLQSRRDNEKFLRLISTIAFIHQYQREIKEIELDNKETLTYIECNVNDYRIAYNLLSEGVLDNTMDDLPRTARELLDIIKRYINEKSKKENIPPDRLIFERKNIREYSSWSFAQVRNNFQVLKDYEYIQLIKSKNGLAHQYRLSPNYSDINFLTTILSPEELEKKLKEKISA